MAFPRPSFEGFKKLFKLSSSISDARHAVSGQMAPATIYPFAHGKLGDALKKDKENLKKAQFYRPDNIVELQTVVLAGHYLQNLFEEVFHTDRTTTALPDFPDRTSKDQKPAEQNAKYFKELYERAEKAGIDFKNATPQAFARFFTQPNFDALDKEESKKLLKAKLIDGVKNSFRIAVVEELKKTTGFVDDGSEDNPELIEKLIQNANTPKIFALIKKIEIKAEVTSDLINKLINASAPVVRIDWVKLFSGDFQDNLKKILVAQKILTQAEIDALQEDDLKDLLIARIDNLAIQNSLIEKQWDKFIVDIGVRENLIGAIIAENPAIGTNRKAIIEPAEKAKFDKKTFIENYDKVQDALKMAGHENIITNLQRVNEISEYAKNLDIVSPAFFLSAPTKPVANDLIKGDPKSTVPDFEKYNKDYAPLRKALLALTTAPPGAAAPISIYEKDLNDIEKDTANNGNRRVENSKLLVKFTDDLFNFIQSNFPSPTRTKPTTDAEKVKYAENFIKEFDNTENDFSGKDDNWFEQRFLSPFNNLAQMNVVPLNEMLRFLRTDDAALRHLSMNGINVDDKTKEKDLYTKFMSILVNIPPDEEKHINIMDLLKHANYFKKGGEDIIKQYTMLKQAANDANTRLAPPLKMISYLNRTVEGQAQAGKDFTQEDAFKKNEERTNKTRKEAVENTELITQAMQKSITDARTNIDEQLKVKKAALSSKTFNLTKASMAEKKGLEDEIEALESHKRHLINAEKGVELFKKEITSEKISGTKTFYQQTVPAQNVSDTVAIKNSDYKLKEGFVFEYATLVENGNQTKVLASINSVKLYTNQPDRMNSAQKYFEAVLGDENNIMRSTTGTYGFLLNRSDDLAAFYNYAFGNAPRYMLSTSTRVGGLLADFAVYGSGYLLLAVCTGGIGLAYVAYKNLYEHEKGLFQEALELYEFSSPYNYALAHLQGEVAKTWHARMLEDYQTLKYGIILHRDKNTPEDSKAAEARFKQKMGQNAAQAWDTEMDQLNQQRIQWKNEYKKNNLTTSEEEADLKSYENFFSKKEIEKIEQTMATNNIKPETKPEAATAYKGGVLHSGPHI